MHRLTSVPGANHGDETISYVEQPPAPVVLLSSADTDLVAVARWLQDHPTVLKQELRALNLAALGHPAVIDHYLSTTLTTTRLVVIRLLGGRGHWSYGLEQLGSWAAARPGRSLLVLAGTAEEEEALAELSTVEPLTARALAGCMREGGQENVGVVLSWLSAFLSGEQPPVPAPVAGADPCSHDWRQEPGLRVGVIFYRAQRQAGDLDLMTACLQALRAQGLCPRALWVSSLREPAVQRGVADLLEREGVEAVVCGTGFASVQYQEAGLGSPLWDRLGVPVLQLLCSGRGRRQWQQNSIGLGPLDLSLQVVLPELDGRLTTRVGAFKEMVGTHHELATAVVHYAPDPERLEWIARLTLGWVSLRHTPPARRQVALVLANYPTRNSRLANGVGLDTPASAALMLAWLREAGYDLEGVPQGTSPATPLPRDGEELIQRLLAGRSNDPESGHRRALDQLPLAAYLRWYSTLPAQGRERLESVWGPPQADPGLEVTEKGPSFLIRGLRFGRVCLLIQPSRGYERDPSLCYHSPDLPPTHAYLAQYLWIRGPFAAQVVVHVGKHGNLEWLPGKGLGLSNQCFPEWALGPLPHLYPFIVNDPGEGSQAKRRSQAVILDHLTPPLGRAGLHGPMQELEALLDEYWEACQLGGERVALLREQLSERLKALHFPVTSGEDATVQTSWETRLEAADGYLCELKEAQIRLGLHTYGTLPEPDRLAELLLCLARAPQPGQRGLTQALAKDLELELDPWADPEEDPLSPRDRQRLLAVKPGSGTHLRTVGDGVALIETAALNLLRSELALPANEQTSAPGIQPGTVTAEVMGQLTASVLPSLLACPGAERAALLTGLGGGRIAAGPSGAPTRGRPDLLPTGRNFYSVDLRGLPTEAAWDLGRRSAALLLELHLQEQGDDLRHLAVSIWGTATMRNGGEDIAQTLALMGVQPVWDGPSRRMVHLEVIPLSLLGRPRVDVTVRISGLFRDAFPQLVGWLNQASHLVASLDESPLNNPLADQARSDGYCGRVYGSAPGAYGAGLQGLIDSGQWEERDDLGEAYLNWSAWRYEGGDATTGMVRPVADRLGLERRLTKVQVVLHNQDNREHDLLDSDDYYQFQGGLAAAVERVRGSRAALWFGDHSRSQRPRLHRIGREFDKVLRSRVLNPRWISGMMGHGYKGGFEMAASLDYLFAFDASTGLVPDWGYGAIAEEWLGSASVLDFLRRSNPWALRDMAERLLEAHHRRLWETALTEQLERLRSLVLESEGLIEKS